MAQRSGRSRHGRGHRGAHDRRSAPPRRPDAAGGPQQSDLFLASLDEALHAPLPISFLLQASSIVATLEPPPEPLFAGDEDEDPTSLRDLIESFLGAGVRQLDALLLVLARLQTDEELGRRIRHEVAERRHSLPGWLVRLDETRGTGGIETTETLGDGVNVMVGVEVAGTRPATLVVYIDHNLGTLVKNAFALDVSLPQTIERWTAIDQGATQVRELPLADARVRIEEAVAQGRITSPPIESEMWPSTRPFAEWIARWLPAGGTGFPLPEPSDAAVAGAVEGFLASPFALGLTSAEDRLIVEALAE